MAVDVQTEITGMAIVFNVSVAIFGGTAPLVATLLIKITGDNQAPAFYLIGAAVLSLAVLSRIPESHRADIG
jgi:MHS family proline/betaine transporter-like MFS transporter